MNTEAPARNARTRFWYIAGDKNLRIVWTFSADRVRDAIKADEVAYRTAALAEQRALNRSLGIRKWWHR